MNHDAMAEAKCGWQFSLIYWDHFLCLFIPFCIARIDYGTFKQRLVDARGWICSDITLAVIIHLTVLGKPWISKCHHFTHCSNKNWFCWKLYCRGSLLSITIHHTALVVPAIVFVLQPGSASLAWDHLFLYCCGLQQATSPIKYFKTTWKLNISSHCQL